jgi:choline kinase
MSRYFFTNVAANLPSTVPFVGPEAQERARGEPFRARIGANECVFGCIDKEIHLDDEEIKVVVKDASRIVKASKTVMPTDAAGESIGIEKIGSETAILLFSELKAMMTRVENHQEYYEGAYELLMAKDIPFHALDITGLKWSEIDTKQDFDAAEKLFV